MTKIRSSALLAAAVLATVGCAGPIKNMREVAPGAPEPSPAPGKALVVFMRPSGMAYGVQSSVFEMKNGAAELVGALAAKTKVAWQVDPGQHLFMAVGESGDFLSADVVAGRTYYAIVTPRMGVWKARFSLEPVRRADLGTPRFGEWLAASRWVERGPESAEWAQANMRSVDAKYVKYYPDWAARAEADRPRVLPDDGM